MMVGEDKNNRKQGKKHGFVALTILLFIGKIMTT